MPISCQLTLTVRTLYVVCCGQKISVNMSSRTSISNVNFRRLSLLSYKTGRLNWRTSIPCNVTFDGHVLNNTICCARQQSRLKLRYWHAGSNSVIFLWSEFLSPECDVVEESHWPSMVTTVAKLFLIARLRTPHPMRDCHPFHQNLTTAYVTISYVCCDLTDPDQILPSTSGPFFQISQAVVVKFQLNPCVAVGFFVGSPTLCCYTPYQTVNHKRNNSASSLTTRTVRTRQARGRVYNDYKKYFSSIPLLGLRRCNVKRTD